VSAEEISDLLDSATRDLGVRVNHRRVTAVAVEIRRWYCEVRGVLRD
jgi:hypothetical protein